MLWISFFFFFLQNENNRFNEFYSYSFLIYLALGVKNIIFLLAQNSVSSGCGSQDGKCAVADRQQDPVHEKHRKGHRS